MNDAVDKPNGVLYSPNFPGQYGNDLDCSVQILRPPDRPSVDAVIVRLETFETEECCDWLQIDDRDLSNTFRGSLGGAAADCKNPNHNALDHADT